MCSVCWISAMVMDAWMIEAQSRYCWSDMILWNMRIINLLFIEMTALWERDRAQRAECSLKRSPLSSSRKWQENLQEMLTQWFQCAIKGGNTNIPAQLHNLTMEKKPKWSHNCTFLSSTPRCVVISEPVSHSWHKHSTFKCTIHETSSLPESHPDWLHVRRWTWLVRVYDVRLLLIIQSM